MFHLKPKPSPPESVGRETPGHAVDSSATGDHARHLGVEDLVELPQEGDRLEVLAPAVLVGHPLAGRARVVAVEHRGDGVDAEAVDVVLASQ